MISARPFLVVVVVAVVVTTISFVATLSHAYTLPLKQQQLQIIQLQYNNNNNNYRTRYYDHHHHHSIRKQQQQLLLSPHVRSSNVVRFATNQEEEEEEDDDDDDDDGTITTTTLIRTTQQQQQQSDTKDALNAVGWSVPMEGELTSEDPFVQQIDINLQNELGISLDQLLNPAKVVNLERDLYLYRTQLATLTGANTATATAATTTTTTATTTTTSTFLTTEECDNGGGGTQAEEIRNIIRKKEADLLIERRSVFRNWLKNVFLIQAILSFGLSYIMASQASFLFGQFDWYWNPKYNMDISISVLGYWWWWLFVIPSLRSRRPKGYEKSALDMAFLASPLVSLLAPIVTKDTVQIWYANAVVVLGAYAIAYLQEETNTVEDDDDDNNNNNSSPEWLKFVYKSLDFGTGRERGARN